MEPKDKGWEAFPRAMSIDEEGNGGGAVYEVDEPGKLVECCSLIGGCPFVIGATVLRGGVASKDGSVTKDDRDGIAGSVSFNISTGW